MTPTQDAAATPQDVENSLLHDARACHDSANVDFSKLETDGEPNWIVAAFDPDASSGSATIPNASLDADTGELVIPTEAEMVVVKRGSWRRVTAAKPESPESGSYAWSDATEEKRSLEPEDYYSPFALGGTALFQLHDEYDDIEQFEPVYVVFPEWVNQVNAAQETYQEHRSLLEQGSRTPPDVSELQPLLGENNPLVTLLVAARLLEHDRTQTEAWELFTHSEGRLKAVLAFVLLTDDNQGEGLAARLAGDVQSSQSVGPIRSIALGTFAADLFHASPPISRTCREVLTQVRAKLQDLSEPLVNYPDLQIIFEKMSIAPN